MIQAKASTLIPAPLPTLPTLPSNSYETLDELKRLLAEADEDFKTGSVVRFRSVAELRAHAEDVKARGRARQEAK